MPLLLHSLLVGGLLLQAGTHRLTVSVTSSGQPVEGAIVRAGSISRSSDARGQVVFTLPTGIHRVSAAKLGFRPETLTVELPNDSAIVLDLQPMAAELEELVVTATRSARRIEDDPVRVEVLGPEEVEEKIRMTPGDITMMLNETPGLRVQTTSPSLGGAGVRVQGLRSRYTQILADGLPLYGAQTGGLGLLQIPPLDLAGVEVIKGISSALYGGSALGGVVNLLSRRPGPEGRRELLFNQSSLAASDATGFLSGPVSATWGYTVLGGFHRQSRLDRDGDGWTDVPGYSRGLLRPRIYWEHPEGHRLMLTAGATLEERQGGTLDGATAPDGLPYAERLRTGRLDGGATGSFRVGEAVSVSVRGSAALQRHRHTFGPVREEDRHLTWFGEAAASFVQGGALWVIGLAHQEERYRAWNVEGFDFAHSVQGVFAQLTAEPLSWLSFTASGRGDHHSEYGTQWSPRLAVLLRPGGGWSLRLSAGRGYFAPTPFTEETEVIGLTPLAPLAGLDAERAWGGSLDLAGPLATLREAPVELLLTVFGSRIAEPVALRSAEGGLVKLVNLDQPTRTAGVELLLSWRPAPFYLSGSVVAIRSREQDPETGIRRAAPLVPRSQAGLLFGWEAEGRARIGVEVYYTGSQPLAENPYRATGKPQVHLGILGERRFGPARVFLNAENLLGVRQTKHHPLVLPARGMGGRWTTDVWAPLDGRTANLGVRLAW